MGHKELYVPSVPSEERLNVIREKYERMRDQHGLDMSIVTWVNTVGELFALIDAERNNERTQTAP